MTENRKKIIYSVLAALCFVILLAAGCWKDGHGKGDGISDANEMTGVSEDGGQDYYMVVMGDSIMGQVKDGETIPAKLEALLGKKVYSGALGGTCMGRLGEDGGKSRMRDALSMVSFSKAIVSGDFRVQQGYRPEDSGTDYFPETIAGLAEIDFSKVEVLVIEHCVNDYHAGEVIYPEEDMYDEDTYVGALRSTVKLLQQAYPDLRIVLVTPTYTWYTLLDITCEEYVRGGNILEDYVNAELAVAEELGLESIDLYHDVYPHETWEDWKIYSSDGLHPNEAGREMLAQIIADYFVQNPGKP